MMFKGSDLFLMTASVEPPGTTRMSNSARRL